MLPFSGFLYHRTWPILCIGSIPVNSISVFGFIRVSSAIINSPPISRLNLSSPNWAFISSAHFWSLPGCSCQYALYALKPFTPNSVWLPYSSSVLLAPFQIRANWSSSLLGVLVIIALPPVDRVGVIEVQNNSAILGLTNANSSR